jgi:hypothetical protein
VAANACRARECSTNVDCLNICFCFFVWGERYQQQERSEIEETRCLGNVDHIPNTAGIQSCACFHLRVTKKEETKAMKILKTKTSVTVLASLKSGTLFLTKKVSNSCNGSIHLTFSIV